MGRMPSWDEFEAQAPALAADPRVHPVASIIGDGRLFVFMEPTSPKGHDLRERDWYSLHNGVRDTFGTGGEFHISGRATLMDDSEIRAIASRAASYQPEDRYVLFELEVNEARCHGYGDVPLPDPRHWVLSTG